MENYEDIPRPIVTLESGIISDYAMDSIYRQYQYLKGEARAEVGPALNSFQQEAWELSRWAVKGIRPGTEFIDE